MVPNTRYAKTPDGGYIAYKVLGEGPPDIAVVGSIATNIEVFFEHEPAAVKDLVAGSGLEFKDRGAHTLKGVPSEWRLYAVIGA